MLQSLVSWPNNRDRITVASTLGPSSFTALNEGDFARLIQKDVALTGDLPMNGDAVNIVVGLLAAPGDSILDQATEFLGDLASLTQVPQLTAAAPVASKIAQGVDKLLGNDDIAGLLAMQASIQADRLKDGYLVVTDWPTTEGALDRLAVTGEGLRVRDSDDPKFLRPPSGFNFLVLDVQVTPSKPQRWRQLASVADLAAQANEQLARAKSAEDVAAAGSSILVAMSTVLFEPNLTTEDQEVAAAAIEHQWADSVARRSTVLGSTEASPEKRPASGSENDSDASPNLDVDVDRAKEPPLSMGPAADLVTSQLRRMRRSATD